MSTPFPPAPPLIPLDPPAPASCIPRPPLTRRCSSYPDMLRADHVTPDPPAATWRRNTETICEMGPFVSVWAKLASLSSRPVSLRVYYAGLPLNDDLL